MASERMPAVSNPVERRTAAMVISQLHMVLVSELVELQMRFVRSGRGGGGAASSRGFFDEMFTEWV